MGAPAPRPPPPRGADHTLSSSSALPFTGFRLEGQIWLQVMRLQTQFQSQALLCGTQRESTGRQKASKGDSASPQEDAQ